MGIFLVGIVVVIDKRSIKILTLCIIGNFHSFIVQFHELLLCQRGSISLNLFGTPTFIQMKQLKAFIDAKSGCFLYLFLSMVGRMEKLKRIAQNAKIFLLYKFRVQKKKTLHYFLTTFFTSIHFFFLLRCFPVF